MPFLGRWAILTHFTMLLFPFKVISSALTKFNCLHLFSIYFNMFENNWTMLFIMHLSCNRFHSLLVYLIKLYFLQNVWQREIKWLRLHEIFCFFSLRIPHCRLLLRVHHTLPVCGIESTPPMASERAVTSASLLCPPQLRAQRPSVFLWLVSPGRTSCCFTLWYPEQC